MTIADKFRDELGIELDWANDYTAVIDIGDDQAIYIYLGGEKEPDFTEITANLAINLYKFCRNHLGLTLTEAMP